LVLALFLVYIAIESESIKKQFPLAEYASEDETVVIYPVPPTYVPVSNEPVKPVVKKQILTEVKTKPNDEPDFEKAITPTDFTPEIPISARIDSLPGDETLDENPVDDIDFIVIEEAPIFPGCEDLTKEASKACFSKEISKFINKKFNTGIAEGLHLNGKQKIWVEFKIDKTGIATDIRARASHKKLEKEAIRIVKKLPQMTPGKQRLKPVNVRYTLPITFQIN